MSLVEKVDKTTAGQVFELLLWVLNVAGVVMIGLISWLMSNLVDKIESLDIRTRDTEISIATLASNKTTLARMEQSMGRMQEKVAALPSKSPPEWVTEKLTRLEQEVHDCCTKGKIQQ